MTDDHLIAKVTILIHAPVSRVWQALIEPDLIQKYLFGTRTITDWKVGSPIKWRGEWQGKTYEDKGAVLRFVPEKLIETTYWSSMGDLTNIPENYKKVTYELKPDNTGTYLTLTQDNNTSEEDKNHSEQNWTMVLENLKRLVEQRPKVE
jgi:uncharacterized protein YndB with AHSA1/START domain